MVANYRPAGSTARGSFQVHIDPEDAGWDHTGIRVLALVDGEVHHFETEDSENVIVPLEGSFDVEVDGELHRLEGRVDVFSGPTDVLYVPRDAVVAITSRGGGRTALTSARARRRLPVQYVAAKDVPVIIRGAGNMTRRVFDFCNVGVIEADRLLACEVFTPSGNWSSYPPHKHDIDTEHESQLEEIYYFEIAGDGYGYQRVSGTEGRPIDVLEEVRSGDVVLVPHGWHGPAMAPPGFDMYYLNAMAGSGEERAWKITDEPTTAGIRDTWKELEVDVRVILP